MGKKKQIIIDIVCMTLIVISCICISGTLFYKFSYGDIDAEQLYFTLTEPVVGTSEEIINNIIIYVSIPSIILISIFGYLYFSSRYGFKLNVKSLSTQITSLILVCSLTLTSLIFASSEIGVFDFIAYQINTSTLIEDNYVDPIKTNIKFPEEKKNLIVIYLESMETTFTSAENGGYMQVDLIPELSTLAKENIAFSNTSTLGGALEIPGTTWTTAGVTSATFGIPLKVSGNLYGTYSDFLPGAYGLYEIMKNEGYYQMVMKGAPIEFGGMEKMFNSHGNPDIMDYDKAIENGYISKDYFVFWGIEDAKLYEMAKTELTKMASLDQPFFFTMETVDTHSPRGYVCGYCRNEHGDVYSNVIRCASRQVGNFIDWCKQQEWYENTTIVLLGDHLTMNEGYVKNMKSYQRTTYNCFINATANASNNKNRQFTTLDMFPTILASIGCEIEGDKLGLGTNLFSNNQTLIEEYGLDFIQKEIKKKSVFYNDKFINNTQNQ